MSQQKNNQILYKYYPPKKYVLDALSKGTICFTDLYSQNDPFEAMGFYRKTSEYESTILLDSTLQRMMDQHMTDDNRDFLRNECRIFCATTRFDRPLMWAHYAHSHCGICVGYNRQDVRKHCTILENVKYQDEPLEKGLSYDKPERFLLLKATDWKYEKEIRGIYIIQKEDCTMTPGLEQWCARHSDYDKEHIFFSTCVIDYHKSLKIPVSVQAKRRIIKSCEPCEVILGLCTPRWMQQRVKKICKKKQIPLYQAKQEEQSFKINKVTVPLF